MPILSPYKYFNVYKLIYLYSETLKQTQDYNSQRPIHPVLVPSLEATVSPDWLVLNFSVYLHIPIYIVICLILVSTIAALMESYHRMDASWFIFPLEAYLCTQGGALTPACALL